MKLEEQLEKLAELGFTLNEGVTIDDLLYSLPREVYEENPFGYLLSMFGACVEREPWNRDICSRVWKFDTECIYGKGNYTSIVKRLCLVANKPNLITDIKDFVDIDSQEAWLKYKIKGEQRHWTIEVDNDWVDMWTISYIMEDIEEDAFHFYSLGSGQLMLLFYLDETGTSLINKLSNGVLQRITPS